MSEQNGSTRREFLVAAASVTAAVAGAPAIARGAAPFELEALPWKEDALAPHISANTISFHYGKHHRGYLTRLNELVQGTDFAAMTIPEVVKAAAGKPERVAIFNAAAQAWNHSFYWRSLRPGGGGNPPASLRPRIEADFTSLEAFLKELATAATSQFGSGWAWLVQDAGKLKVTKTANADTPLTTGQTPLLTLDVWEHAYYLDYQNRRPDYVDAVVKNLLNWDFVAENLAKAK